MFRKFTVVVLFISAALPCMLAVIFLAKQQYVRHQMKERLEKENTVTLTISCKDLQWFKKDKELLIEGRFFDIKTITTISADSVRVTGLFDEQEKQLHELLAKNIKDEPGNDGHPLQLAKLLFSMHAILPIGEQIDNCFSISSCFQSFFQCNYPQLFLGVICPPPQPAW
jgi:hypothetical protein